jgi:putative two-component system response regulator
MPGLDGYETCRRLKRMPELQSSRVIVVSAHSNADELQLAFDAGADDFVVKPVAMHELLSRVRLHMRLRRTLQLATELQSSELNSDQLALEALERSQEILAGTLLKLAENRDNETGEHLVRMAEYAVLLAEELQRGTVYADQIDDSFIADLKRARPLHDIGKVGIPDEVLLKPGRLTLDEYNVMKEHTTIGANILEQAVTQMSGGGFLLMAVDIARFHHERWDAQGYPTGLAGREIPLCARIVSVADVYDALTTERCYKEA